MTVIIDTSIICSDYFLSGSVFRVFFEYAKKVGYEIVFPEIVLDEASNHYSAELFDARKGIDKHVSKLGRMGAIKTVNPINDKLINRSLEHYNKNIHQIIKRNNIEVVPYPSTSHKQIAQKAMSRRKPFNDKEKGYRDSLIWENVKDILKTKKNNVCLITSNNRDFFNSKGDNLHEDLINELRDNGINSSKLSIYSSLDVFKVESIEPFMEFMDNIKDSLDDLLHVGLDLRKEILIIIEKELAYKELDPTDIGLPRVMENVSITFVEETDSVFEIINVRKVTDKELLLNLKVEFDAQVDYYIFKSDYWVLNDDEQPSISDYEWNDHYYAGEDVYRIKVNVEVTTDIDITTIISHQISLSS